MSADFKDRQDNVLLLAGAPADEQNFAQR